MLKSHNTIAIPPGATIKEQLNYHDLTQKEFALRMNISEKHISKLINGEVQLTPEVAIRLEMVLGVPAHFWNKLEANYREKIIKVNLENEMDADIEFANKIPYEEMTKLGWLPTAKTTTEKVIHLRKFFEVVNLKTIIDMQLPKIACRRLAKTEESDFALLAWAQKARIEARSVETSPIDLKALNKLLPQIKEITCMDPIFFTPKLTDMLAKCGIALILLPYIGGKFLHGATFYAKNKIVIGLTLHDEDADKFRFSLFHELGHIILGHIKQIHGTTDKDEEAANNFAKEILKTEYI